MFLIRICCVFTQQSRLILCTPRRVNLTYHTSGCKQSRRVMLVLRLIKSYGTAATFSILLTQTYSRGTRRLMGWRRVGAGVPWYTATSAACFLCFANSEQPRTPTQYIHNQIGCRVLCSVHSGFIYTCNSVQTRSLPGMFRNWMNGKDPRKVGCCCYHGSGC